MKILKITLLLTILSSCKTYKDSFINEYGDEVLYTNQTNCNIFEYNHYYKRYNSEKCFKLKYNFDKKAYEKLKKIYYKVSASDKKRVKKQPFYAVYKTIDNSNNILVNKFGYGLFYVSGKLFAPNFYYLRTENNGYFYDCEEKTSFFKKLDKSNLMNLILKNKIKHFILERCKTKNNLKWYSGARFY